MTTVLEGVRRLGDEEILGALAVVVEGLGIGSRAVIEAGVGYTAGSLPDQIAEDVLADAEALMYHEQSRTLTYR
ncbi:MAG: hypothetical protein U9O63_02230, partial [Actinomycetota bacterium]|nr:hypothetical protein [Actinomycetota bacterium]